MRARLSHLVRALSTGLLAGLAVACWNTVPGADDDGSGRDVWDGRGDGEEGWCGDGVLEEELDEQCDDGNFDPSDSCVTWCGDEPCCRSAFCGDGYVHAGVEECDDGNTIPGDGCDVTCQTEARCGDGYLDAGEECDDGNSIPDDECTDGCTLPACGDGILQAGETCDDGNTSDLDECLATCVSATCGDGFVSAGREQCDDGAANSDTVADACRTNCHRAYCGDGIADAGEECDDGNLFSDDVCIAGCRVASCGDGFVRTSVEECDGGVRTCSSGCGSVGAEVCSDCFWSGACSPPLESCNGRDDDCDTAVDNGFPCVPGATVPCTTTCRSTGSGTCTGSCGVPPDWSCVAPAESCNGRDDDCDGETDETADTICGASAYCFPWGCRPVPSDCTYVVPGAGLEYLLCTGERDWNTSRTLCSDAGMHLVKIESADENSRVYGLWSTRPFWIGLEQEPAGAPGPAEWWHWIGEWGIYEPFRDWDWGQPDDWPTGGENGEEDCAEAGGWGWNDIACGTLNPFICEQ